MGKKEEEDLVHGKGEKEFKSLEKQEQCIMRQSALILVLSYVAEKKLFLAFLYKITSKMNNKDSSKQLLYIKMIKKMIYK